MTRVWLAAIGLAAGGGVVSVHSQALTGTVVTATVSQRFEADTNYRLDADTAGTSYFSDTRLDLEFLTETPTQQLSLGIDTGLRAISEADRDFELTYADPVTARAAYDREWAGSDLSASLSYRRTERDLLEAVEDFEFIPAVPDDLQRVEGTENRYDARFELGLRTDAPSSYRFTLRATRFDYSDAPATGSENDTAVPRTTVNGEALWTLRLNPVLSTATRGSYELYTAEDETDTEITLAFLDTSLVYAASEVLSLSGGFGYTYRERTEVFGDERFTIEEDWGPALRGGLRYELPYVTVDAEARVSTAAPNTRLTGNAFLRYDLARGEIRGRAFQNYSGDDDGEETVIRGLGLGVTRELNTLSRIGLDLAAATERDANDSDAEEASRLDATLTYSRDLTRNLSSNVGYRFRHRSEELEGSASSNAVFFTIGRTFSGRP